MSPRTKITVGGSKGKVSLEAVIDTGFDGDVSIPVDTAISLGVELIDRISIELGDGSTKEELVFRGFAIFLGKRRNVEILVSDNGDALIGTNLLIGCKLSVDFASGKTQITR